MPGVGQRWHDTKPRWKNTGRVDARGASAAAVQGIKLLHCYCCLFPVAYSNYRLNDDARHGLVSPNRTGNFKFDAMAQKSAALQGLSLGSCSVVPSSWYMPPDNLSLNRAEGIHTADTKASSPGTGCRCFLLPFVMFGQCSHPWAPLCQHRIKQTMRWCWESRKHWERD